MNKPAPRAPAGWLEALAESEAELDAGRAVPLSAVLRELNDSAAELESGPKNSQERRRRISRQR